MMHRRPQLDYGSSQSAPSAMKQMPFITTEDFTALPVSCLPLGDHACYWQAVAIDMAGPPLRGRAETSTMGQHPDSGHEIRSETADPGKGVETQSACCQYRWAAACQAGTTSWAWAPNYSYQDPGPLERTIWAGCIGPGPKYIWDRQGLLHPHGQPKDHS